MAPVSNFKFHLRTKTFKNNHGDTAPLPHITFHLAAARGRLGGMTLLSLNASGIEVNPDYLLAAFSSFLFYVFFSFLTWQTLSSLSFQLLQRCASAPRLVRWQSVLFWHYSCRKVSFYGLRRLLFSARVICTICGLSDCTGSKRRPK